MFRRLGRLDGKSVRPACEVGLQAISDLQDRHDGNQADENAVSFGVEAARSVIEKNGIN
jgi:hypothetical protein